LTAQLAFSDSRVPADANGGDSGAERARRPFPAWTAQTGLVPKLERTALIVQKQRPQRNSPRREVRHAGGEAVSRQVLRVGELGARAQALIVVLDGIEDPHNLGAIVRTAHAAGAAAVVIPERRAAGLTDTVSRTSAGALAYLPVVRVANINRALEDLKERGYWIYGLDERGKEPYDRIEYTAPTALVLGAEGKGLHQTVAKHCDFLVSIPMIGSTTGSAGGAGIASLNVSVAAGVVLFEWRRRAGLKPAAG